MIRVPMYRVGEELARGWLRELVAETIAALETYLGRWAAFEEFARRSRRVLLVDDDDLFRSSVRTLLEGEERVDVVGEARNGEEAVQLADSLEPDLVVLDIDMPVLDGIRAARAIRAARPVTRVVVLSGSTEPDRADEAKAAGAEAFLRKGELRELLALVA